MKLTQKNYYSKESNESYMSVSQYKDFCKCEAMAMAKINGTYQQTKSRALILGSLFDELLTGTKKSLDQFVEENKSELFKKNGESIEVRYTWVPWLYKERVSGWGEGWSAEVFDAARAENAGSSEKIRRIVTKVERYHSCPYLI